MHQQRTKEQKKILLRRIVYPIVYCLIVIIPFVVHYTQKVELIDSECYSNYYSNADTSFCDVELTFDKVVGSGYVDIDFFNSYRKIARETVYVGYDDTTIDGSCIVTGDVDSYEIVSYDISLYESLAWMIISYVLYVFIAVGLVIVIWAFMLSCKVYEYNGNQIVVYAGFYHHYISVDGEKYDEHNTFESWSPIYMNCELEDGAFVEATVSMSNRIALKINGRLVRC